MKIKKKLYWNLILRYLVFLTAAIIATVVFIISIIGVVTDVFSKYPEVGTYTGVYINSIEYDNKTKELKLAQPIEENSWIEILKDNRVVFIQGKKQDDKMIYTQEDLAFIVNNMDKLTTSIKYITNYIPFTGTDGENYTLLYKRPKTKMGNFKLNFDVPLALQGSGFEKEINGRMRLHLWLFLFSIFVIILLFSRITSKKIINPLKAINGGLENIMAGDYTTRLEFKGSYEFTQIRDAFNYMTKRLQIAERENKEISDSKKKLLLDISHDLRTPVTTIQGYAQALSNDMVETEEEKKKYLNYICEKSKSVTNLVETLFKYTKLESSVYDLDRKIDDLSEFLRSVIIGFYGELEEKTFDLDIQIPEHEVLYNFDKVELERAISNIIGNIIKYNPKGTRLSVSLEEGINSLHITIEDSGVGIPKDIQKNIFNALVRGDNTRKTDGGTGLGLAISKKIIELHGGTISIDSQVGKGSKFYIDFEKIEWDQVSMSK